MAHIFDFSHIINYEEYAKNTDNRKIYLGHGTNGYVYKIFINGSIPIALKEITLHNKTYQKQLDNYEKETTFLKNITHPNIIKVFFSFEHYNEEQKQRMYYIGMECASKSLEAIIEEKTAFTEQEASELAQQLYRGLEYIQANNAVHRDIKPANIVLGTDGFYKLCDFGECQIQNQQIQTMALQSLVGSPVYFSPELLQLCYQGQQANRIQEYNPASSEVFSFGLVILKCLLGRDKNIFGCNQDFDCVLQKIQEANLSNYMRTFLLNCLAFDRRNRYTFKKMKEIFEFNAIQVYFNQQEFNSRASYESLQIQTASSFEEQRQIMMKLANQNQNLINQVSTISNEGKELRAQLAMVTDLVKQLQKEVKAQTSNKSPLKNNDQSQTTQYQQQLMNYQQQQDQKQNQPIQKIQTQKSQHIDQNLVQQQSQPVKAKKQNQQIYDTCYKNEKVWENQDQEWRKKEFTKNSQGLKWNNYNYNNNNKYKQYKQYYYNKQYNNNQYWNEKTGQKQNYTTYWKGNNTGNAIHVCDNDIPKAIGIVNELVNTTEYEFGLCLMMLHSNIWNFDKSVSDLMN